MEIIFKDENGILTVDLQGRLDATTAGETEKKFKSEIEASPNSEKMIINLSKLEYISSAGLRVLLVITKLLKNNNGKLCLCGLDENVSEIFKISGFDAIFNIAENTSDALAILND